MNDDPDKKPDDGAPGSNPLELEENTAVQDDAILDHTDDDDLDFIGAEDLDDLDDETFDDDWDEFDDPLPPEDQAQTLPPGAVGPQKKSFFLKYFNVIVIAVAVIGAGLIFVTQFGGSNPPSPAPAPVAQNDAIMQDIPADTPQAASIPLLAEPVETMAPQPLQDDMLPIQDIAPVAAQEPVTAQDAAAPQQIEIASWEDMLAEEAGLQEQQSGAPVDENNPVIAPDPIPTLQPVVPENDGVIEDMGLDPAATMNIEEAQITPLFAETPPATNDIAAPQPMAEPFVASNEDIARRDTQINELQDALRMRNSEIDVLNQQLASISQQAREQETQTDEAQSRIRELEDMITALQDRLKQAEEAQKPVTPTQTAPSRPAPNTSSAASASSEKAVRIQPVAPQTQRVEWSLRAAQPGLAVIAPRGTNDLKSVTIGNYVDGLGQITAIENLNNRWTVVGTTGRLSQ